MARVIISAGHSPVDKGAVIGGLVEYDLTRQITDELEELLKKYPKLDYRRVPADFSLPQKIQWINESGYIAENNDIAVEVHINDADGTEDGIECWHAERGENCSKSLCTKLIDFVSAETGMRKRAVNSEYDHPFRRLGYVHNTRTISALIEIGFMDHPKDKKILTTKTGVKKIAKGLLLGILDYYGLKEGDFDKEPDNKPKLPIHTDPGVMPNMGAIPMPGMVPTSGMMSNYANTFNNALPGANYVPSGNAFSNPYSTFPSYPQTGASATGGSNMTMQERQDMLTRLFQKILGRNPDARSLNYYSSSQMSEEALMKLMIDSQEHKNLLKAARDYVSTKSLLAKANQQIAELQSMVKDRDIEISSLRQFFHKDKEITVEERTEDSSTKKDKKDKTKNEKRKTSEAVSESSSKFFDVDTGETIESKIRETKASNKSLTNANIKKHSLKSVYKPAGPIKGLKRLVKSLGKLIVRD